MSTKREAQLAMVLANRGVRVGTFTVQDAWSDPFVMLCRNEANGLELVAKPYELMARVLTVADVDPLENNFIVEDDPTYGSGDALWQRWNYPEGALYSNYNSRQASIFDNRYVLNNFQRHEEVHPPYVGGSHIKAVGLSLPIAYAFLPSVTWIDLNVDGRVWADVTPRVF